MAEHAAGASIDRRRGTMARELTMEEAVGLLRPVDTVAIPLGPGAPTSFLRALATRTDWEDLELAGALLTDLYEVLMRPGARFLSGFFGPAERFLRDNGAPIEFVPGDFRRFGTILEARKPRVMTTVATPPDADGWCSLSLHAGASVAELHRAGADPDRLLLVEANPLFPRTLGYGEHDHRLHVDEIDVLVVGDRAPFALEDAEPTEAERKIAELAMGYIKDGSTLQTGIGGVPSMVARLLAEGEGGSYGVHSEMFTTGLMHLHKAGKVTNDRKGCFDGVSITTFAAGTPELYAWLDGNEDVRFLPVDVVNAAEHIAANQNMVSINGAVCIDLAGQLVADTIDNKQFSGIGGHEDFIAGTGLQSDDRSLICMPSTSMVKGEMITRIVAAHPAGAMITTPRHQVDTVITEYGAAELQGLTERERAEALAEIAHPDFRPLLRGG
jgi:acyl-CoA hydrolase